MSSILKALKRLENDAGQDRRREPWPSVVAPESRARRRTRRIFRWNVLLSGLMISAAVVGGLWLFFSRNPERLAGLFPGSGVRGPAAVAPAAPKREASPEPPEIRGDRPSSSAPSRPVSSAPARAPRGPEPAGGPFAGSRHSPNPGPPPGTAPRTPGPAPRTAPPRPGPAPPVLSSRRGDIPEGPEPVPRARPAAPAVDPPVAATVEPPAVTSVEPPAEPPVESSVPTGPAAGGSAPPSAREVPETPENLPAEPAPAPPERTDPVAGIAEASDPRFHIQALVWSENPSERMAVVNGRIVKAGNMVGEAVRVTAIGADYLIFQEGGNRWKHRFRVK